MILIILFIYLFIYVAQQWSKNLDQRIRLKINPPDDDEIVKIGGKSMKG